jgi:hypothetical protein
MTNQRHYSDAELQELLDGRSPAALAEQVRAHIDDCPVCSRAYRSLQALDTTLRRVPLEETGPAFTATVMTRLHIVPSGRESGKIFELFAFAVGMLLVLAVMTAAFYWSGLIPAAAGQESDPALRSLVSTGEEILGGGGKMLSGILSPVAASLSKLGALHVGLLAMGIVAVLALIDLVVGKRIVPRS